MAGILIILHSTALG